LKPGLSPLRSRWASIRIIRIRQRKRRGRKIIGGKVRDTEKRNDARGNRNFLSTSTPLAVTRTFSH